MFYIPNNLLNDNYTYHINNDSIIINTHTNCTTQDGIESCDCIDLYPHLNYLYSNSYTCSTNDYNSTINNNYLSNNFIYRTDFPQILFMVLFACIIVYLIPFKIYTRLFRRWA